MKKIIIMGEGCDKCDRIFDLVNEVVSANAIEASVEKENNLITFLQFGVTSPPAIVINDKIVCQGNVPNKKQILKWIMES